MSVDGTGAEPAEVAEGPRLSWWLPEVRRGLVSSAVSVPVAIVTQVIVLIAFPELGDRGVAFALLTCWTSIVLIHGLTTAWAFRGLEGERLRIALQRARRQRGSTERRRLVRMATGGGDGPSWSVQVSVMALFVVGVLALSPQVQADPLLTATGLVLVATCWINAAIMYAVHYARMDIGSRTDDGSVLGFSGDEERAFSDYVHLAVGVQTLGTSDVQLRTRTIRRQVTLHGLLAFGFNTVIIVMIVSLILRLG